MQSSRFPFGLLVSSSLLSSSLLFGVGACDSKPADTKGQPGDKAGPEVAPTPGPAVPTDATPPGEPAAVVDAPAAKPPVEHPKPRLTEVTRLHNQLVKLLNEGRALTKKGDYAGGIAKYRQALELDASDVTVLGELGWAAFKAGDLDDAHRSTTQALKFAREDKQRGMLLYNLGRIAEDRDKLDDAITHYKASLVARPANATVEARLAAVEALQNQQAIAGSAGGELEGPDPAASGLAALGRDLADLAAVCKLIEAERCEDYTLDGDEPCKCAPELLMTPGADTSWGLVPLNEENQSMQVAWFPAIKTDKGWTVFSEVLYSYNPGMFGIFEDVELLPSTVEPLLGAGTQLVMKFKKSRMDRDMGLNEIEHEESSATVICARHETGAYCTLPLLTAYSYTREVEFEGEDEAVAGGEIDHSDLSPAAGFTATFEFRDAALVVAKAAFGGFADVGDVAGTMGWVLPDGTHPLAKLLGLPG